MFKIKMGREIIGSLFWFAVGALFALISATMILGTFRKPGPGFLPLGVALLLILCSLIELVKSMRKPITPLTGILWKRPAIVLLSVFLFGFQLVPRSHGWFSRYYYASHSQCL
jgi:asparagine N-glycosylation enzyme membrane subunit Stt3